MLLFLASDGQITSSYCQRRILVTSSIDICAVRFSTFFPVHLAQIVKSRAHINEVFYSNVISCYHGGYCSIECTEPMYHLLDKSTRIVIGESPDLICVTTGVVRTFLQHLCGMATGQALEQSGKFAVVISDLCNSQFV